MRVALPVLCCRLRANAPESCGHGPAARLMGSLGTSNWRCDADNKLTLRGIPRSCKNVSNCWPYGPTLHRGRERSTRKGLAAVSSHAGRSASASGPNALSGGEDLPAFGLGGYDIIASDFPRGAARRNRAIIVFVHRVRVGDVRSARCVRACKPLFLDPYKTTVPVHRSRLLNSIWVIKLSIETCGTLHA